MSIKAARHIAFASCKNRQVMEEECLRKIKKEAS